MHFRSEGYYFTEVVPWLELSLLLLGVVAAWKLFRRTLSDPAKDELKRLNERYARGLLSFEQYQRERALLHQSELKARQTRRAPFDANPVYTVLCCAFSAVAATTFIALVIIRLLVDS